LHLRGDGTARRAGRLSTPTLTTALPSRLILGGGIGGLATGIALAERGMSATVLERSRFADESGTGIQLGPNATRVLRQLGALDTIEAVSFKPGSISLFDGPSGRRLAAMPLGDAVEARYGAPYLTLHRADLHASLLAVCRGKSAIELLQGFNVSEVRALNEGVEARTGDGRAIQGASLIAADGVWSLLRRQIAPAAELRFAGATAWRALLPRESLGDPFSAPTVGLWLGSGAHLVHYPVRRGDAVNVVAIVEDGSAEQGWNREADPAPLQAAFNRWAAPARALLDSVETWRCWSLYQLKPLGRWTEGRVALLGDAAHPVLPYLAQGAALAIEDAATLAASLEAARGDDLLAFPHYEALRRRRVRRVQRQARRYGLLYHLGSPFSLARNFVLSQRRPESLLAGFDWLYRTETPRRA
jgi:2-polyprenyl-6-methoxyphenol hydroxylase-like FAD-dependent oxidoreductase